ncbi:MAG: hypothetical protein K5795_00710, partial [Lachnospiraceae bacterium]|nr:hypothetical protein [Lachnospiraceae bacterium]
MKRKWCRALGIILSVCMLSGDLGTIAVSAAGDPAAVSAEAAEADSGEETDATEEGTEAAEDGAGQKEGEPAEETPAEGGEAVSENDAETEEGSEEESASENEAEKEEASEGESASENEAEEGESASENKAEEGESASENETEEGVSDEETVSENETEETEEKPDDGDNKEWKVVTSDEYTYDSTSIKAGSYEATANVTIKSSSFSYPELLVIFTDKKDADFFSDSEYVSRSQLNDSDYVYTDYRYCSDSTYDYETGYHYFYYSIPLKNDDDSSSILHPSTTYAYRIARYEGYDSSKGGTIYGFMSAPKTFTTKEAVTESKITIDKVEIYQKGYFKADFKVTINNPQNETLGQIDIVEKNNDDESAKVLSSISYNDYGNCYEGTIYKSWGDVALRLKVYTGDCVVSYKKIDIAEEFEDSSQLKPTVSVNAAGMIFNASATVTPYYKADYFYLYLYYRKKGSISYQSQSDSGSNGRYNVSPPSYDLAENTEYEYYVQLQYYDGNGTKCIANIGNSAAPETFTTGTIKHYTEEDFADKGLYAYLKNNYTDVTDVELNSLKYLSVSDIYDKTPVKSLADIPEKIPNITSISMDGHDISDITPLLDLKYLKYVSLSYNDISSLPDLSKVSWESLSLQYNFLTTEAIAAANLPQQLVESSRDWYLRKIELTTLDTYYADANDKYPIIIKYLGDKSNRNYKVTISVNGISKDYTQFVGYGKLLVVDTAKDDFNLTLGTDYTAKFTVNDGISDVFVAERPLKIVKMPEQFQDIYALSGSTDVSFDMYFNLEYNNVTNFKASVLKDGKTYMNSTYMSTSMSDRCYDLYKGLFDSTYVREKLSYKSRWIYFNLAACRVITAGDYDVVIYPAEGEALKWEKKLHVTTDPVVTYAYAPASGYDNNKKYIYFNVRGYNLNETTYPVIVGKNGKEYTKFDSYKDDESNYYIYKLEKVDWSDINNAQTSDQYVINFKGSKLVDQRSDTNKNLTAGSLRDSTYVNLYPISSFYNWKAGVFEFTFNSTVPAESTIIVDFYSDSSYKNLVGSGSAKMDAKNHVAIAPTSDSGAVYKPVKSDYYEQYVKISCGSHYDKTSFDVSWYNLRDDDSSSEEDTKYVNISTTKTFLAAPASSIGISVSASKDSHATNKLSARLNGTSENTELKYTAGDKSDTFYIDKWTFSAPLQVGDYELVIYETVDGVETALANKTIYVRDSSKFYITSSYGYFDSNDDTKANCAIYIPLADIPDISGNEKSKLEKLVKDLGLKVELFDCDLNAVNATITPSYASSTNGYISFAISGLDKNAFSYYVRFTSNGKTPLDIYSVEGKEYYADTTHGNAFNRSSNYYLEDGSEYNAYYYLNVYGSDAASFYPISLNFYELAYRETLVQTLKVTAADVKNNTYYFTKSDIAKLDAQKVYICTIVANNKKVSKYTGYFAAKEVEEKPVPVTGVSISQGKTYSLAVGSTVQLTAVIAPSNANQYTGLSW